MLPDRAGYFALYRARVCVFVREFRCVPQNKVLAKLLIVLLLSFFLYK